MPEPVNALSRAAAPASAGLMDVGHAPIKSVRENIESIARQVLGGGQLTWQGYQATIEAAGALVGATMVHCASADGKITEPYGSEIESRRESLVANFRLGLQAMSAVTNQCFQHEWHTPRGKQEESMKIRAAATIAQIITQSGDSLDLETLTKEIKASYKYASERLRKESVAEEFWGCLIAAAHIGTREAVMNKAAARIPDSPSA